MNKKTRGRPPSLIGSSNGKPEIVFVKKKSECTRCHSEIRAGQRCAGIPKVGAFKNLKRYCKVCFTEIIIQTKKDLEEIEKIKGMLI